MLRASNRPGSSSETAIAAISLIMLHVSGEDELGGMHISVRGRSQSTSEACNLVKNFGGMVAVT